MTQKTILFNGVQYDVSKLSLTGQDTLRFLNFAELRYQEAKQKLAVLSDVRFQALSKLRSEIVEGQSGINLREFLAD